MKPASYILTGLCLLLFAPEANAHVTLLYPQGGETFVAGSSVKIDWRLDIRHEQENWDLYYSPDGGSTWIAIQLDIPEPITEFDWTVPDMETTHGKIRIVQDNQGPNYVASCDEFSIQVVTTATEDAALPTSIRLLDAYPNPVVVSTSIDFELTRTESVLLEVFDVTGTKIATLTDGSHRAGRHHLTWNARGLAPGVYVCRLQVSDNVRTKGIVVVR